MTKPLHGCATHSTVPFQNFQGVAVTTKGLMTEIKMLCTKMSRLLYLLTCFGNLQPENRLER